MSGDSMEAELRGVLGSYQENLALLSSRSETEETLKMKREIETAIKHTLDVLDELQSQSPPEDQMQVEPLEEGTGKTSGRKRQHYSAPAQSVSQRALGVEYLHSPADFALLREKYPSFRRHTCRSRDGRFLVDFSDPLSTVELTRVLLKEYYGLNWDVPLGQLVPPVPCRAKYIVWIHDILQLLDDVEEPVVGLDIGCGANCIYPLLGASMYGWHFVGSDVTDVAVQCAQSNVYRNPALCDRVQIVKVPDGDGGILSSVVRRHGPFHFSMCNPPFFSDIEEAGRNHKTAFGGTPEELVHPGGERAFVEEMVEESLLLRAQVCWYSVMLGKKTTFKAIRTKLYALGVITVRTTTFQQGKMTRWAIAWSFTAHNTNDKPLQSSLHLLNNPIRHITVDQHSIERLVDCMEQVLHASGDDRTVEKTSNFLQICHDDQTSSIELRPAGRQRFACHVQGTLTERESLLKIIDDALIILSND